MTACDENLQSDPNVFSIENGSWNQWQDIANVLKPDRNVLP